MVSGTNVANILEKFPFSSLLAHPMGVTSKGCKIYQPGLFSHQGGSLLATLYSLTFSFLFLQGLSLLSCSQSHFK